MAADQTTVDEGGSLSHGEPRHANQVRSNIHDEHEESRERVEKAGAPYPSLAKTKGQSGKVASATTKVCLNPAKTLVSCAAGEGT